MLVRVLALKPDRNVGRLVAALFHKLLASPVDGR
jgi:hypothetical protein